MFVNISLTTSWLAFIGYLMLILSGLIVPSDGQHGLLSIKSLTFLFTCGSILLYAIFKNKITVYHLKLLLFFVFSIAFLLAWLFIGILRENSLESSQLDQFKLFIITLSFPLMTLYLLNERVISISQILKMVIFANFFYVSIKIILVSLHLLNWVDIWQLMGDLGFRFMRMSITGGLERVQTSVDIVTPFFVFFLLESDTFEVKFNRSFKAIYLILAFASTLLSFSRYLIFIYLCSLLIYSLQLKWQRWMKIGLGLGMLMIICYIIVGPDVIDIIIQRRLTSLENYNSDSVRLQQMNALLEEYEKVPFFGKGLGGYSPKNIRDTSLLHHYELQWFAFLMQFGLLGLLGILSSLVILIYRFCLPPFSIKKFTFFTMFILWIVSGFLNPFLISLASGIMYMLFLVSSIKMVSNTKTLLTDKGVGL